MPPLVPGRRRSVTHDPVEPAVAAVPQGRPAGRHQRHAQLKRLGVILALVGVTLLFIAGSDARLGVSDRAQKLFVMRVESEETSGNADTAVGEETRNNSQQQQQPPEDARPRQSPPPLDTNSRRKHHHLPPPQTNVEQEEQGDDNQQEAEEQPQVDSEPLDEPEATPAEPQGTRGIILCLHNGIAALGKALIRDLRCMGNRERIQVYHCLPAELSDKSRSILTSGGDDDIEIVDVCSKLIAEGKLSTRMATSFRSYWIKPLALLHSSLDEVLMLDADALPLQDPAVVRSLPGYMATGTTFFHDRVIGDRIFFNKVLPGRGNQQLLQNWIETFDYAAFGLTGPKPSQQLLESAAYKRRTSHEMDSSMVLVDKRRAGKALDVLWSLITEKRFKIDFSWGDKEAFWLAFEFAHVPYFFSPWSTSVVSSSPNKDMEQHSDTLCGSIAHYLPVDAADQAEGDPELLYVNGKALLQQDPASSPYARKRTPPQLQYNPSPTHVTPRHLRSLLVNRNASAAAAAAGKPTNLRSRPTARFPNECLVGLGATPLSERFQQRLLHRREVLSAIEGGQAETAGQCPED